MSPVLGLVFSAVIVIDIYERGAVVVNGHKALDG